MSREWETQVCRIRDGLSIKYAECVYNGFWFSPEMEFLENAMNHTQRHVNGETRLRCGSWFSSV
jgi:argininosuccinate synthase